MGNAMRVSRNDDATPRSRRDLLESGVSRRVLAGSRWSSPHRGFHRDTVVNDPARQRILDAAVLLPDGGAVAGWAAAYLQGVSYLDGRDEPVLLAVPPGRLINRPGIAIMRAKLDPGDLVTRHGLPCTGGARTAFDMLRRAPGLVEAVVAGDCLLHSGLVTEPALATYVASHPGRRGIAQLREALSLLDPATASPPESRLRMLCQRDAGLPRLLVNVPVYDVGGDSSASPICSSR
jgi:hypothetical protein